MKVKIRHAKHLECSSFKCKHSPESLHTVVYIYPDNSMEKIMYECSLCGKLLEEIKTVIELV